MHKINWLAIFGLIYGTVWVIGLLIPTGTISPTLSNVEIQNILLENQLPRLIQVYLIDGLAGISIFLFAAAAASLSHSAEEKTLSQVVLGAGIAACTVSLIQAGVQQTLVNPDLLSSPDTPFQTLLVLVNQIDTFKLMALAVLSLSISILGFRARTIPTWINWLGAALALMLLTGGLSFAISSSLLSASLIASLPILLIWVGAVSVVMLKKKTDQTQPFHEGA